jgi:hypothetical protein
MHTIESYSKYITQLVREEKYENVLINFEENKGNFAPEEIASNSFLINSLLRSYREQRRVLEGIEFLNAYKIDIYELNDRYSVSQYGWLLFAILKSPSEFPVEKVVGAQNAAVDLIGKFKLTDEFFRMLISQLMTKLFLIEKNKDIVTVDLTSKILKSVDIQSEDVKNIIKSDPYLVAFVMDIFRKSRHVERAIGFMKFLGIDVGVDCAEQIVNAYGWALYSKLKLEINDLEDDESEAAFDSLVLDSEGDENSETVQTHPSSEALNLVYNSIEFYQKDSKYSPFSKLFRLSLKYERKKPNPNWNWIIQFLSKVDRKKLTTACESFQFEKGGKTKTVELASDVETWYSYYTLAALKRKSFDESLQISKEALFTIEKFHYNNDLWLARKIALCNKGLGNIEQAIDEMKRIESRKGEWFIQRELAELYLETSDIESAMSFAIKSALSFGDREKKDGLFFLIGQILTKRGDKVHAFKHFQLSKLIRDDQGWSIPQKLKVALMESEVIGIESDDLNSLYKELLSFWKSNAPENPQTDFLNGEITRLNIEKEIGSILSKENSKSFFFRFKDFKGPKNKLIKGIRVKFRSRPPKSDGQDWVAFDIRI